MIEPSEQAITEPAVQEGPTSWDRCAIIIDCAWYCSFVVWLMGRIIGDRNSVAQLISWIPTLGIVALGALWLACRAGDRRRHRLRRWGGLACAALAAGAAVRGDFRPWVDRTTSSPLDIRLVQWNTDHPSGNDQGCMAALAGISNRFDPQLFLISNPGSIATQERAQQWAGAQFHCAGAGPFACVTTFPITESRVIAAVGKGLDTVWVAKFVVLPPSWNGRPLRIAMVDLPSKPTLSRMQVAQVLSESMIRGGLGEVDLVAGDFNALPGSWILARDFPMFHDSWDDAGTGLRATWPRIFPLWSIDHVLLSQSLRAISSVTADPGVSKHRLNALTLRPVKSSN